MVLLCEEPHQGLWSVSKHFFQYISKAIDLDVIWIEKFLKTVRTWVILNVIEHSAIFLWMLKIWWQACSERASGYCGLFIKYYSNRDNRIFGLEARVKQKQSKSQSKAKSLCLQIFLANEWQIIKKEMRIYLHCNVRNKNGCKYLDFRTMTARM